MIPFGMTYGRTNSDLLTSNAGIRMKTQIAFALIVLISITGAASGAIVTQFTNETAFRTSTSMLRNIDFDAYSGGYVFVGNEYAAQGISIIHRDSQAMRILDSKVGFTQFHNLNINSSPSGLGSSGNTENIDFTLSQGSLAAGLWIGNIGDSDGSNHPTFDHDTNGTRVQFLGVSGSVIAERFLRTDTPGIIQGPAIPNNRIFYGISYSGSLAGVDPIKTIRIFEGNDGEAVVFDNIQFSTAAVPEPSSLLILMFMISAVTACKLLRVDHKKSAVAVAIRK